MTEQFMLHALAAGLGLALIAAPLGCFVMWRRMAYFGEAVSQSGLIGVALGLGVGALIGAFGRPVAFSVGPVLLAFGCAFLTGLVFGLMPARKAARLDPVVALAKE